MTRNNLCIISISLGFNTETMSTPYVFLVEYTLNDPIYIILEIEIFRNNCVSNSPYVRFRTNLSALCQFKYFTICTPGLMYSNRGYFTKCTQTRAILDRIK